MRKTSNPKYGYTAVPVDVNLKTGKITDHAWDGRWFDTANEVENYIADWGSKWIMYPGVAIFRGLKGRSFSIKGKRPIRLWYQEMQLKNPNRKLNMRTRKNPITTSIGTVLIVTAAAYFGWCAITYFTSTPRVWSWTPWKALGIGYPQLLQ